MTVDFGPRGPCPSTALYHLCEGRTSILHPKTPVHTFPPLVGPIHRGGCYQNIRENHLDVPHRRGYHHWKLAYKGHWREERRLSPSIVWQSLYRWRRNGDDLRRLACRSRESPWSGHGRFGPSISQGHRKKGLAFSRFHKCGSGRRTPMSRQYCW